MHDYECDIASLHCHTMCYTPIMHHYSSDVLYVMVICSVILL